MAAGATWRHGGTAIHTTAEWFSAVAAYDILQPEPESHGPPRTIALVYQGEADGAACSAWARAARQQPFRLYGGAAHDESAYVPQRDSFAAWDLTDITGGFTLDTDRATLAFGLGYAWGTNPHSRRRSSRRSRPSRRVLREARHSAARRRLYRCGASSFYRHSVAGGRCAASAILRRPRSCCSRSTPAAGTARRRARSWRRRRRRALPSASASRASSRRSCRSTCCKRATGVSLEDAYNLILRRHASALMVPLLRLMHAGIRVRRPRPRADARRSGSAAQPRPAAVVSVFPNFNGVMRDAIREAIPGVPLVVVLTDLADFPPRFWIEPGIDRVVVGTDEARGAGARDRDPGRAGLAASRAWSCTRASTAREGPRSARACARGARPRRRATSR